MSRVNYGAKPIMLPQPVLIIGTYDENGVPNAMNAAWGITTDFKEITISLSEHKTTDNFKSCTWREGWQCVQGWFTAEIGGVYNAVSYQSL